MLTEILLTTCAVIFLYLSYRYAIGRPKGFPPGPPRIPFFGSYLFMMMADRKFLHKGVLKFSKWYKSDIVGFHMGCFPIVAVHNAEAVREVLNNQDFDGRPQTFLSQMRSPISEIAGILFREGPVWHEQRRFILRYLRDYGFGRRFAELELVIQDEIGDFLDLIRNGPRYEHEKQLYKPGGYRVLLPYAFNTISINSLLYVILNERIPRSEQADLVKLVKMGLKFQRNTNEYGTMLSILPWVRHVFPERSSYNTIMECNEFIYNFFAKFIDHYIETYEEGSERNFVDLYIKEMKQEEAAGQEIFFYREQFILSLLDFAIPTMTSVGAQLSFLVQYLMLYPEIMKRIQAEIDDVVGDCRLPTLEDRQHMPYTEAAIRECLRIETLVPSDVAHKATVDTELMGYKIPKDTIVMASLYACHNDERVWGDPKVFRPERFLDDNGKLCLKKDVSLPFSAGRRLCAGETFSRNILFLMCTAVCQNFNIVLAPGDKLPDLSTNLSGFIASPADFWIQLEERNK